MFWENFYCFENDRLERIALRAKAKKALPTGVPTVSNIIQLKHTHFCLLSKSAEIEWIKL